MVTKSTMYRIYQEQRVPLLIFLGTAALETYGARLAERVDREASRQQLVKILILCKQQALPSMKLRLEKKVVLSAVDY